MHWYDFDRDGIRRKIDLTFAKFTILSVLLSMWPDWVWMLKLGTLLGALDIASTQARLNGYLKLCC